jgi:hypothetical protein
MPSGITPYGSNSMPRLPTSPTSCAPWRYPRRSSISRSPGWARSWSRSVPESSATASTWCSSWPRLRCRERCSQRSCAASISSGQSPHRSQHEHGEQDRLQLSRQGVSMIDRKPPRRAKTALTSPMGILGLSVNCFTRGDGQAPISLCCIGPNHMGNLGSHELLPGVRHRHSARGQVLPAVWHQPERGARRPPGAAL